MMKENDIYNQKINNNKINGGAQKSCVGKLVTKE